MNSALPERSTLGKKPNGQDAEKAVGAQVGVNGINVLKDTDIGVFRNQGGRDKSTYTKTTKPDGTVVEKVKIDRKSKNKGLVDVGTQGINIGDIGVDAAISPEASEDAVSFVDSIWGSKTAAGKTQDARMKKLEMQRQILRIVLKVRITLSLKPLTLLSVQLPECQDFKVLPIQDQRAFCSLQDLQVRVKPKLQRHLQKYCLAMRAAASALI